MAVAVTAAAGPPLREHAPVAAGTPRREGVLLKQLEDYKRTIKELQDQNELQQQSTTRRRSRR